MDFFQSVKYTVRMGLADELRRAIKTSGKGVTALGRETGVPQPMLTAFMQGKDLRLSTADKLCRFFNLSLQAAAPTVPPAKSKSSPAKRDQADPVAFAKPPAKAARGSRTSFQASTAAEMGAESPAPAKASTKVATSPAKTKPKPRAAKAAGKQPAKAKAEKRQRCRLKPLKPDFRVLARKMLSD